LSGVVLNLLTSSGPTFWADHTVIDMGRHRLSIGTIKRGIGLPSNKKAPAHPCARLETRSEADERKCLQGPADNADAMVNSLVLQRKNQCTAAADYWRRYLAIDRQSQWATRARRSLRFREMQHHLIA
jgi:hypothetical protein